MAKTLDFRNNQMLLANAQIMKGDLSESNPKKRAFISH